MDSATPHDFRHASFHGRIGVARADITPPVGIYSRNWGAAKHDVAESIHLTLTLTVLTLTPLEGGSTLVLIDADLGWWKTPQTFQNLSEAVTGNTVAGIHESDLCTQSHPCRSAVDGA